MSENEELKGCPFCGTHPSKFIISEEHLPLYQCCAHTRKMLEEQWNTRKPAQVAMEEEALHKIYFKHFKDMSPQMAGFIKDILQTFAKPSRNERVEPKWPEKLKGCSCASLKEDEQGSVCGNCMANIMRKACIRVFNEAHPSPTEKEIKKPEVCQIANIVNSVWFSIDEGIDKRLELIKLLRELLNSHSPTEDESWN